ncbi:SDR family NAD(P)-dependent oxidoreductase [Dactylosporangium salmoneum]|uniref:SDR family NAD(P)-dependent oxidoreductase n=1 Tax=Dactylosporangium salmoneum TaxID=53361 RepID=A0ABP5ULY5_9ACTN
MTFGFDTTAAEVLDGVDLTGRRAVVTGGASGIGVETARALAGAGAEVTLAVRDLTAGERTAADIVGTTANKGVRVAPLDLADRASVRAFVSGWDGPLHILVGNAGVMACPLGRTPEGWELQFATNHVGHFTLATGLLPALRAANGARVVAVSSSAHHYSPVVFDDIQYERREYAPWPAYGQSKTANILFAVEADRRWSGDGIRVNALHPGSIRTNLQRHVPREELDRMAKAALGGRPRRFKTTEQGAATSVLLATVDGGGGRYFEDCAEAPVTEPGAFSGVAPYALDPEAAERLWDVTTSLVKE